MSGWDKDGMSANNELMVFFSKMRQHDMLPKLVDACGQWWIDNKPVGSRTKR